VSTNTPGVVQNLFLFGGKTDQQFEVQYCGAIETNHWLNRQHLEFLDPAGTLYYLETLFATNTPPKDFYRAALLP